MEPEARLLGSGGWLSTDSRETACVYLRLGPEVLLLDAGSGARRLVTEPELIDGVERLSVVCSHFHLDHVVGLAALSGLEVETREIWLPARLLSGVEAADLLERLVGAPFFTGVSRVGAACELEGDTDIGSFSVAMRVQPQHPGRSLAFRVGDLLAYCTDTRYDQENVEFARGVRVFLHEAFWPGESTDDPGHTAAGDAGRLAAAAEVERLVLVHVNPVGVTDDELVDSARAHFPSAEVGRDNLVLL